VRDHGWMMRLRGHQNNNIRTSARLASCSRLNVSDWKIYDRLCFHSIEASALPSKKTKQKTTWRFDAKKCRCQLSSKYKENNILSTWGPAFP
jgi:hypothetical protein